MSGGEFVGGSDVEHGDEAVRNPRGQLRPADRLGGILTSRQTAQDTLNLRQVPLGHDAQQVHQLKRLRVGQPVNHSLAVAAVSGVVSMCEFSLPLQH